jgi:succinate dehydrogenase / fumarate reductase, cytochrome b subunit
MSWFTTYVRSSVGAKHIVGVSGLLLILFLIAHLAGNLQVFLGPEAMNEYGVWLRGFGHGAVIWIVRAGLLAVFVVHVAMTMRLAVLNRAARPVKYHHRKSMTTKWYSRSMAWTGLLIFAFVVYHLLHFTYGLVYPDYFELKDPMGRHDVYRMLVLGFQVPVVAISYIVAMALLCAHLAHGTPSWFQSLGWKHPKYDRLIEQGGKAFAWLLFLGYVSIPVAVWAGLVTLPGA